MDIPSSKFTIALMFGFLLSYATVEGRSIVGSARAVSVKNCTFFERINNPCHLTQESRILSSDPMYSVSHFYQEMVDSIKEASMTLKDLEKSHPIQECEGVPLNFILQTPLFDRMNATVFYTNIYRSGIHLAAHLHVMMLDRQTRDDNTYSCTSVEDIVRLSNPVHFRIMGNLICGTEPESLIVIINRLIRNVELVLCTLMSWMTNEQAATFQQPMNELLNTKIISYRSSCSSIEARDCLLIRDAKQLLKEMLSKFTKLINPHPEYRLDYLLNRMQDDYMESNDLK